MSLFSLYGPINIYLSHCVGAHPGRRVLYLYSLPWGSTPCLANSFHHQQLDNKFYTHLRYFFHLLLLVLHRYSFHFFSFVFNCTLPLLKLDFLSLSILWTAMLLGYNPHLDSNRPINLSSSIRFGMLYLFTLLWAILLLSNWSIENARQGTSEVGWANK